MKRTIHDNFKNEIVPKQAEIQSIQFGIYTSSEIKQHSSVEINNVDINKCGAVQKFGVNDSSMGVSSKSMICSTCFCPIETCQGHMGHLELAIPVINVEFLSHIFRILSSICYNCSEIRLDMKLPRYKDILDITGQKKRQYKIFSLCHKIKTCFKCGTTQPVYKKEDIFIYAIFEHHDNETPLFTPKKMKQILKYISDENINILGMCHKHSRPHSMIWENFIIPPVSIRPPKSKSDNNMKIGGEDDLTIRLRTIVRTNHRLKIEIKKQNISCVHFTRFKNFEMEIHTDEIILDAYKELQRVIACYQDLKYQNKKDIDFQSDNKSIRQRFSGQKAKKGRMRNTIFGKRQNYSSRTVITPDTDIEIDEVGVPKWMCMKLTYPETVHKYNIHKLTRLVRNGASVYPGANFVVDEKKKTISLKSIYKTNIVLKIGWVVKRHLVDGDYVLFNRQPSLHKMSLMCHRVRVMNGNTFRIHIAVTKPYNADFDGDEMNLQVLLSEMTRAEASELMSVKNNIVKDMVPIISFQQHSVAAAYYLTKYKIELSRENAFQLLCQCGLQNHTNKLKSVNFFSGMDLISIFLPDTMCCSVKDVVVQNGILKSGVLNNKKLNKILLYIIWKDFGKNAACKFINKLTIFLETFLNIYGSSIGVDDCHIKVSDYIKTNINIAKKYVQDLRCHHPSNIGRNSEMIENNICLVLDKTRDIIGAVAQEKIAKRKNGLFDIINSGAKGNITNITQIVGMVGQQRNHRSERLSETTSHYGNSIANKHGMIINSFFHGLTSIEYFNHLIGSRVGLVDTAVKTSETGYSQRRIGKAMEDVKICHDQTVRNENNHIIQFFYGGDGFDSSYVEYNKIRFIHMSEQELIEQYKFTANMNELDTSARERMMIQKYDSNKEISTLIQLRKKFISKLIFYNIHCDMFLCPIKFKRLLKRATLQKKSSFRDITAYETRQIFLKFWSRITSKKIIVNSLRIKCLFFDWCSTKTLYDTFQLDYSSLKWFFSNLFSSILKGSITPNESVGVVASQNCAEPLTQMTLNRFHKSGQFSNLVTGVARMREIINAVQTPQTPSMTIFCKKGTDAKTMGCNITVTYVNDIVEHWSTLIPSDIQIKNMKFLREWTRWCKNGNKNKNEIKTIVLFLKKRKMINISLTPAMFCKTLRTSELKTKIVELDSFFSQSTVCSDKWWVCLNIHSNHELWKNLKKSLQAKLLQEPDDEMILMTFYEKMIKRLKVKGIDQLEDFYVEKRKVWKSNHNDLSLEEVEVLVTKGSNIREVLKLKDVDVERTTTNHIREVEQVLGVDAARNILIKEWKNVMIMNDAHVGFRHIGVIVDNMCRDGYVRPMTYQGICTDSCSVIKKASFEKSLDAFIWGAAQGKHDVIRGSMESICWNSLLKAGTGNVKVFLEPMTLPNEITLQQNQVLNRRFVHSRKTDFKKLYEKYLVSNENKTIVEHVRKENINEFLFTKENELFHPSDHERFFQFTVDEQKFKPSTPEKNKKRKIYR